MAIKAQRYTFKCRFESEAHLPGYPGSTLRGALGWSLKKTSCALKHRRCHGCPLKEQCAYAWIFETEQYCNKNGHAINARPHPFVIQPAEMAGSKQIGETLLFSILLLDRAVDMLPIIAYTINFMGKSGIGSGLRHGMGRFTLEEVTSGEKSVYSPADNTVYNHKDDKKNSIELLPESKKQQPRTVTITMQTPLRLKQKNRLEQKLPFHVLIRACLRRMSALEKAYGGGEPELDYRGLINRAEKIKTQQNKLRWQNLHRWSNRQEKKVSLSGIGGSISYGGDLSEFMPIINYGSEVNIGKQTAFGLGRMVVS